MRNGAIGIDVGTSNTKVVLVDEDGTIVQSAWRSLRSRIDGDVAEQDARDIWAAVRECIREVTDGSPTAASDVGAIGCCSQYSSIVPVDASGEPVAPLILWSDKRGTDRSFEILAHEQAFESWLERHGIPPVGGGLALAHMLHLQHDQPDVHRDTRWWLEPMDFVNLQLTGVAAANQVTMFMSQLCDNRVVGRTQYDEQFVELAGVDADRLPPLLGLGEAVGPISPSVADDLGLPADAIVYGAANDTTAAAVATGAFAAGRSGLAIGTTSVLIDTVDTMATDLEHEVLTMPSPLPDTYLLWAENGIGGLAIEHVLREVVHAADALGDHQVDNDFARLDAALATVAPGSGGAIFLPWLNGSNSPSTNATMRGGFINLSLATGRKELVRAAAEGVAHNLRWLLPFAENLTGRPMNEIAFVGGAARSEGLCRILADVLDRPISPVADPDRAGARGTASLAQFHHGSIDRSDLEHRTITTHRHEPDPTHRDMYDEMHAAFEAAHTALTPLYESLNG